MASIKAVLRKRKSKDGTYPLAIRITKDRKSSYIYLGYYIKENQWDAKNRQVKSNHPNSGRLNNLLLKKLSEISEVTLESESKGDEMSLEQLKQKSTAKVADQGFNKVAEIYLSELKSAGKYNRLTTEEPRINRFKEFNNHHDIDFKDITVPLLRSFQSYLRATRNITERTVVNHLVVLRSLFNRAIELGFVERKYYPFGRGKIRIKFPDSIKIGLTRDEVEALEEVDLTNYSKLDLARDIWLISFYFAGMRVSDVLRLKWSDMEDGRLYYKMGKNEKGGSLKIIDKAQRIIAKYDQDETGLVFPFLKMLDNLENQALVQKKIKNAVWVINHDLRKVAKEIKLNKPLTMHIARHTFGNLSGDKIPIQMLQKLYRHSSITTTINYQSNFIHKDTDDALEDVLS